MSMLATAWPAAPVASVWDRMRLPLAVPLSMRRRHGVDAGARTRQPLDRDGISGTAHVFGQWFSPEIGGKLPRGARIMLQRDALDENLRDIAAGALHVDLLIGHDNDCPAICSTLNALRVWRQGRRLLFRVCTSGLAGRFALRAARALPQHRQASIGLACDFGDCFIDRRGVVPIVIVQRALLTEVSLVPEGACDGCVVRVSSMEI